jgi:nucleoside-diphosphate-sugar epimerase
VRFLVTGAAGFIGSHLCRRLVADGHEVVGIDDLSVGSLENLAGVAGVRFVEADIRDAGLVARSMAGCEVVLHQAARTSARRSLEDPEGFDRVNVRGTLGVLQAARETGAAVVFASSAAVYGDPERGPLSEDLEPRPRSPYAATKLAGEGYCRAFWESFDVPTICLRYFNVYGPGQDPEGRYAAVVPRFATACLTGRTPVVYGDGEQTRDFTFIDDAVEANVLAARMPGAARGRVLNVGGGGEPTSVNELLATISLIVGTEPEPSYEPAPPGDARSLEADISSARTLIGYEPKVGLEEGLRRTVGWFRTRL